MSDLPTSARVVIIGGGFIGIEFADEINKKGLQKLYEKGDPTNK